MFSVIEETDRFLNALRGVAMAESPVVTVEQGQLQGKPAGTPSGKVYYSFQGIPYAKPPLGSLRFKDPLPAEPWDGIRDATEEGNVCAQIDQIKTKEFIGGEDCLFLNIYTPNLDGAFLPVMVYIHGGGFQFGYAGAEAAGPDYLVDKDVVVVTINYRCGALGFLSLLHPDCPGNAGLKDQALAIKWVKDNIHNFGGNSGNLTIFGESAGGASVTYHMVSPLTKNLINKAIVQSGTFCSDWAVQRDPIGNAKKLAKSLGNESEDLDDILAYLQTVPVRELVEAVNKLTEKTQILHFVPTVEREFADVNSFLTEPAIDILASGRAAKIPLLIGITEYESIVLFLSSFEMMEDLSQFIPKDFNLEPKSEDAIKIIEQLKSLYFHGKTISLENRKEYIDLASDPFINVGVHRFVKLLQHVSTQSLYIYKFSYFGNLNIMKNVLESLGFDKAGHSDDLGYLFKMAILDAAQATPEDVKTRERVVRMWTNFAKEGNPTPEESHYLTVTWLPATDANQYYLNIDRELSLQTNMHAERMEFWDNLYNKYYKIWDLPTTNSRHQNGTESIVVRTDDTDKVDSAPAVVDSIPSENSVPTPDVDESVPEVVDTAHLDVHTTEDTVSKVEKSVPEVEESILKEDPVIVDNIEKVDADSLAQDLNGEEERVIEKIDKVLINEENKYNAMKTNGTAHFTSNGAVTPKRTTNEIKMVTNGVGAPKDVIRANDPPEDDLPKNIGVNKFVSFFENLGGKK